MLTKLTVVILLQYVHSSNHCAVPLKLIQCYMSIISQLKKIKKEKTKQNKKTRMRSKCDIQNQVIM